MKRGNAEVQYDEKYKKNYARDILCILLNRICMSLGIIKVNNLTLLMNNKC